MADGSLTNGVFWTIIWATTGSSPTSAERIPNLFFYMEEHMSSKFDPSVVDAVIKDWGAKPGSIIPILQGVQEKYNYLPPETFPCVAQKLGVSEARVYGVATFYENFSLRPKGKFIIKVCDGTACHVRKSIPNLERFRAELGLSEKKITTDDLTFTVQTVACLGACSLAPAFMVLGAVPDKVYANVTPDQIPGVLDELRSKL
jgi:NADH-quinone oxidoreductase subunit E